MKDGGHGHNCQAPRAGSGTSHSTPSSSPFERSRTHASAVPANGPARTASTRVMYRRVDGQARAQPPRPVRQESDQADVRGIVREKRAFLMFSSTAVFVVERNFLYFLHAARDRQRIWGAIGMSPLRPHWYFAYV